jgi:D-galactarolactone isomerase
MSASIPAPLPRGACDCHVHIYEHGHPLAPTATFKPPHAPVSAYRALQKSLGLERVVLVQPNGYGFDNGCLLDALAQFGHRARAIAVVPTWVADAELERLHAAGVRGVRFMLVPGGGGALPWDALEPIAARIAPFGWNLNLQLDGRELPQHRERLQRLPGRLVIDHTGKFLVPVATDDDAFDALLAILDRPDRWVKLSAPYETSRAGQPDYADVGALARALARTHPDRCLWASNWPHPNRDPRPDDAALLALLDRWVDGDARLRKRILVDNPAALYGF